MDPWCSAADIKARPDMSGLTDDQANLAAEIASELLDDLSGKRYGVTTTTVRPHGCGVACDFGPPSDRAVVGWGLAFPLATVLGPWPLPGPYGGLAAQCGGCGGWSTSGIDLPGPVVWDVDHPVSVMVDGETLDPSVWSFIDRRRIVRVDGGVLRQCQSLLLASSEPGTCQITFSYGVAVPMAGVQAAISLAVQIALLNGWVSGTCKLPQRVTQVQRQGVVVAVAIDPLTVISEGGTGLTDVDLWLVSVNPSKLRRRATIHTPGLDSPLPTVVSGSAGTFV